VIEHAVMGSGVGSAGRLTLAVHRVKQRDQVAAQAECLVAAACQIRLWPALGFLDLPDQGA